MARFIAPSSCVPSYLNANTPAGLFQSIGYKERRLFWVIEHDAAKYAICLDEDAGQSRFAPWLLMEDETVYSGVALGAVEVELDIDAIIAGHDRFLGGGDLFAKPEGFFVRCRNMAGTPVAFRIGGVLAGPTTFPEMIFPRWRLIQRDHEGAPITLFDSQPEDAASTA